MNVKPNITPDYPGAITTYRVNSSGYGYTAPGGGALVNKPRAIVLHTPEEPADDYESTPRYFAQPGVAAGTHYYLDNDGDIYQMLEESECPYANGNRGGVNRTWKGQVDQWPPWATVGVTLNGQTISIEMEGYAASIGKTWTDEMHASLVALIKHRAAFYGIPLDRDHIIGHFEVATDRTDPGSTFPWERLMRDLQEDDNMPIDITKVRIELISTDVRWTETPEEREIVQRVRLVYDG